MSSTGDGADEVVRFLESEAGRLDAAAPAVGADEAMVRAAGASTARRPRWRPLPPATAGVPRMALAFGATLALLVGIVGGFVAGRSGRSDDQSVAAAGDADSEGDGALEQKVPAPAPGAPNAASGGGFASDSAIGRPVEQEYRRLFLRTAGVVVVRGFVVDPFEIPEGERCPDSDGPDAPWCPPIECYSGQQLIGELSSDNAVGQSWASALPLSGPFDVEGPMPFGVAEQDPFLVWSVRAGPEVTAVRVVADGAVVDQMDAVEGWALLVKPGREPAGTVEALDAAGAVVATRDLSEYESFDQPAECIPPPPALPDAEGDPPADQAAADAAIRTAFAVAFDPEAATGDRAAAVEQGDALFAETADGETFGQAIEVGEIRFVDDSNAALYVSYADEASGQWIAYATVVDGEWKVSVRTGCESLRYAPDPCDDVFGTLEQEGRVISD